MKARTEQPFSSMCLDACYIFFEIIWNEDDKSRQEQEI